ncbi:hypothetical protein HWV62_22686 [Athelia sp. TMB]|nr:hypothetical protein HWV62_22686 [Athelia sp. TMB]
MFLRLTGPLNRALNRIFPDDKPEDTMSTFSLISTEIYLMICSCLPLLFALDSVLITGGNMGNLWCLRTAVLVAMFVLPILHLWSYAEIALLLLGQESEVVALAVLFLDIAAVGIPAYAFNEIAKRFLSYNVNGPPAFRVGFIGAPASSVICHYTIALLTVLCILPTLFWYKKPASPGNPTRLGLMAGTSELLSLGRAASAEWSKNLGGRKCLRGLLVSVFWFQSLVFFFDLLRRSLGQKALAAQAALLVTVSCLDQATRAIQSASATRLQVLVNRKHFRKAKAAALVALASTLLVVLAFSNLLLELGPSWGQLFTSDPMVIDIITSAMPFIAIYQAMDGISSWMDSALVALGRSAAFPVLKASSDFFIGLPLGIYLAFGIKWNLAGLPLGIYLAFGIKWNLAGLWAGLVASSAYALVIGHTIWKQ